METVLVRAGVPIDLERHLERLRASVERLYGESLPADVLAQARRATAGQGDVRLRIHARPSAGGVRIACETAALPATPDTPVALHPVVLPGGLGEHKWRDRRLLDALAQATAPAVPLLVDSDGSVLEAAWGNVWVERDSRHRTPPADGRLLPGIARARRLAGLRASGAAVEEVRVSLDDLAHGRVALTSALRSPTPARVVETPSRRIRS